MLSATGLGGSLHKLEVGSFANSRANSSSKIRRSESCTNTSASSKTLRKPHHFLPMTKEFERESRIKLNIIEELRHDIIGEDLTFEGPFGVRKCTLCSTIPIDIPAYLFIAC
jgi:hypothetical protein